MSSCGSTELSQKLAVSWVTLTWGFSLVLSQRDTWQWPQSAGLLLPAVFQRSGGWHPFFLSITSRVLDLFFFFFLEANDLAAVAEAKPRQNSMLNGVIPFTDFYYYLLKQFC